MTYWSIALADTILARFPDPDSIPYRRWCYVQGYVLCGFERLWRCTGDPKYLAYITRFVDQHVSADGGIRDFTGDSLDDMMAGTAIVAVYELTGEQRYRLAADRIRAAFDDYPRNADGGFWHARLLPYEMWIDGVFMGQMFLTRYGAVIGDREYCFAEAARQILTLAERCRKAASGLFVHAYDESRSVGWADPVTGLSAEVWSEGLGWYALILVETLGRLPNDHSQRPQLLELLYGLLAGLRNMQDPRTGLWYQVVDKGEQADNWHDTSGSAMFVYAIQRAIDLGYVHADDYRPIVERGYAGITSKATIDRDGMIDIYDACDGVCVQRSYADYINYPKRVNAKEAVGSFLWATAIVEKPSQMS
ncbi:MAG TPA: glycoside hydrolase family 88 protein [Roseiflexaceae bacterium]|nr:glycoside hydrolase family 88 protein [Roseiflexaceae bacterium]